MLQDSRENLHSFNNLPNQAEAPKNEEDDRKITSSIIRNINSNLKKKRRRRISKNRKISRNQQTKDESKPNKEDNQQSDKRIDNIRRSAFIRLMIFLKVFFKVMFGLNMKSFNCQKDFGTTFGVLKEKMRWEIYQIFCCNKNKKNITELYQFLKTSISKTIIHELFQVRNPELNIRKISSNNIIDYALEPDQATEIFNAFKYTINFLKNKNKNINELNNSEDLIILERTNMNSNFDDI